MGSGSLYEIDAEVDGTVEEHSHQSRTSDLNVMKSKGPVCWIGLGDSSPFETHGGGAVETEM